MNISYNWLKKYILLTLSPEETAKKLTSIGLETGKVENVESVPGGLRGLVTARVVECHDHPDSDHLHVTKVDKGDGELLQIVCGAPNCREGIITVLAPIGTKLYGGEEPFTIKKSKIRGVESFGMLCAEDEIGIGTSHAGIIELPSDTPVGMPANEYYNIENDYVMEVDITPNRADAISHFGVARDLAAALGLKLMKPSVEGFKVDNNKSRISVSVENTEACPRYSALTISGITIKESPEWLKNKLAAIGIRSINNVVDVTNFILHELGQPLHSFDADKITGGKVIVRTLPDQTKMTTLDGVERSLSANDLIICNEKEGMCIAGVFGGMESGIKDETKNVFLESAYFNPVWIRKTARRHGLNTDASFRYERGCDPNNTVYALKRAAMLIKEVAGGEISSDIIDIYPNPINDFKVHLSYGKVNSLIGKEIPKDVVKDILSRLEIRICAESEDALDLEVPPYRVDVRRDVDVIEDILRIYGYGNVVPGERLDTSISYSQKPDPAKLQTALSRQLTGAGFNEILNNSLTKLSYYNGLQSYPVGKAVKIMNPLGSDLSVTRQTLLFGGLESIAHNRNRQRANIKFYEFGNCYHYNAEKSGGENALAAYSEEMHLGVWMAGNTSDASWSGVSRKITFFDLKAHVINLLTRAGIKQSSYVTKEGDEDIYSRSIRFETRQGKTIAVLGIVSPKILKSFDIDTEVFFADVLFKNVVSLIKDVAITYKELPKYPEVKRDLALLIDKNINFAEIENIAYQTERKLLKKVVLFDVYEGKNLEEGKKSYAVSFTLQDNEKTLEDRRIDSTMERLTKAFEEKLGAKLR